MSERNAPREYGLRIGLVSGLFAIGQVWLSVAAARGSEAQLRAIQQAFGILASGGIADPTILYQPLLPMLAITYLSMLAIGLLTLWFAAQAGKLAAVAQGRHGGGGSAGMWVWLVSTLIWLAASVVATVLTNSDGTISGVFTGTFSQAYLPQELFFLLMQEMLAALVSLGFCAMVGAQGARNALLLAPESAPSALPVSVGFAPPGGYLYGPQPMPGYPPYPPYPAQRPYPGYPGYPPYPGYPGYPPYPGYPGYPTGQWGPVNAPRPDAVMAPPPQPPMPSQPPGGWQQGSALPYPPPPSFYVPQQSQPLPQSEPSSAATTETQPAD